MVVCCLGNGLENSIPGERVQTALQQKSQRFLTSKLVTEEALHLPAVSSSKTISTTMCSILIGIVCAHVLTYT